MARASKEANLLKPSEEQLADHLTWICISRGLHLPLEIPKKLLK